MARKFEKPSGRISLRISEEMHLWLGETAGKLGLDVNKLIVEMIKASAPTYEQLAEAVETAKAQVLAQFSRKRAEDAILQAEKLSRPSGPVTEALTGLDLLMRLFETCLTSSSEEWTSKLRQQLAAYEPTLDAQTADRLVEAIVTSLGHQLKSQPATEDARDQIKGDQYYGSSGSLKKGPDHVQKKTRPR